MGSRVEPRSTLGCGSLGYGPQRILGCGQPWIRGTELLAGKGNRDSPYSSTGSSCSSAELAAAAWVVLPPAAVPGCVGDPGAEVKVKDVL